MDLYFQGRALLNKEVNLGHLTQARTFLERALRLDPGNIEALYSSAIIDLSTANGYFADDRLAYARAGEAAVTKVLSLLPDHAQAHGILGAFYVSSDRVAQGIAEYHRALELDRNLAWVHANIGQALYMIGRGEETEAQVREALRLSPGIIEYTCGIFLSAAPSCGKALTMRPPLGFGGASKRTATMRMLISYWQSCWHTSVSWTRRERKHSPAWRSILALPSAAIARTCPAAIPRTSPGVSAFVKGCA
jgi:tetratricopeptide (TPR) repeat protein